MSMMVSFVLSFFPRDVLDEILNLIESVSEGFPSYSYRFVMVRTGDLLPDMYQWQRTYWKKKKKQQRNFKTKKAMLYGAEVLLVLPHSHVTCGRSHIHVY